MRLRTSPRLADDARLASERTAIRVFELPIVIVQDRIDLQAGDRLVLFTDGVTELWNRDGAEFGEDGLLELVRAQRTLGAAALQDAIVRAVTEFSHGDFQDDVTLVVVAVQ